MIDHFRNTSRIVEPQEQVDPYAHWTKYGDPMRKELTELQTVREPAVLADRISKLHRDGVAGKHLHEVQFFVLHEGLPLAPRVSEAFTMELLALVPAALANGTGEHDLPKKQGELLERALFLAGHFGRADILQNLSDAFTALVRSKPEEVRYRLICVVAPPCLRILTRLDLWNAFDRFLTSLHGEVLGGASLEDLRKKHAANPESWALALQTLLTLVGGWLRLGLNDRFEPILREVRHELLAANTFQPKDCAELARAYVRTFGDASAEMAFTSIVELFQKIDSRKITNTWTTAQYYSRFHLNLVEDTVLTLCPRPEEPVPAVVTA